MIPAPLTPTGGSRMQTLSTPPVFADDKKEMKHRWLTRNLLNALRQGDKHLLPFMVEDDIELIPGESGKFRVIGASRDSIYDVADYLYFRVPVARKMVGAPSGLFMVDALTLILSEMSLDSCLREFKDEGLYCGRCEEGRTHPGIIGMRQREGMFCSCCEWRDLMTKPFPLYTLEPRNVKPHPAYTEAQFDMMQRVFKGTDIISP